MAGLGALVRAVIAVPPTGVATDVPDVVPVLRHGAEVPVPQVHQPPVPGTKGRGVPVSGAALAEEAARAPSVPPARATAAAAAGGVRTPPVIRAPPLRAATEKAAGVAVPPGLAVQVPAAAGAMGVVGAKVAARAQAVHTDLLPVRSPVYNVAAVGDALGEAGVLLGAKAAPDGLAAAVAGNAALQAVAAGHPPEGDAEAAGVRVP